jgi:hypothetical protein
MPRGGGQAASQRVRTNRKAIGTGRVSRRHSNSVMEGRPSVVCEIESRTRLTARSLDGGINEQPKHFHKMCAITC